MRLKLSHSCGQYLVQDHGFFRTLNHNNGSPGEVRLRHLAWEFLAADPDYGSSPLAKVQQRHSVAAKLEHTRGGDMVGPVLPNPLIHGSVIRFERGTAKVCCRVVVPTPGAVHSSELWVLEHTSQDVD